MFGPFAIYRNILLMRRRRGARDPGGDPELPPDYGTGPVFYLKRTTSGGDYILQDNLDFFRIKIVPGVLRTTPVSTAAPVASAPNDPVDVGEIVSVTNGTWNGYPSAFAYQWYRDGVAISGATSNTYQVTSADFGTVLTATVIATNGAGTSAPVESNGISVHAASLPVNVVAPDFSAGPTYAGTVKGLYPGTWLYADSYLYRWYVDGVLVSTSFGYTIQEEDEGKLVTGEVAAVNSRGTSAYVAATDPFTVPVYDPPENITPPAISGSNTIGSILSDTNVDTWTFSPTSYQRRWKRDGVVISGATSSTYTLVEADAGTIITMEKQATNADGPSGYIGSSNSISVSGVPYNTGAPVISSATVISGVTISDTNADTWTGSPSSYARQWYRDSTAISGATGSTYVTTDTDIGHTITLKKTATNGFGTSVEATSNSLGPIISAASWGTTYTQALGSNSAGWTGYTVANKLDAASLSRNGTKIRVTVKGAISASAVIVEMFIGRRNAGFTFNGTPTRITFNGGSNGVTVSNQAEIVSDEINFNLDETLDYMYTLYISAGTVSRGPTAGAINWKSGNTASNYAGDGTTQAGPVVVSKIETYN